MEGKTVLLTGASGAIGSEVARKLAARGARLVLSARRVEQLEQLAGELAKAGASRPVVAPADLSRRGAAAELAAEVGDVDALINNAGASMQGLSWVVGDRDEARQVLETNLWSPLALIAALAPAMVERGRGAIVNVGSMVRVAPFPHLGHYAASRAALALATEVMHMELGQRGIRVVEVSLGPVDTPAATENRSLAGADAWLDGRPGLGKVSSAAGAIVEAASGSTEGVTFYPRSLRWPHRLPGLGRRYARRMARGADLRDEAIRLGGSTGDPELRSLRDRWETESAQPVRAR